MSVRSTIRLVLNGRIEEFDNIPPTLTVLEFLRDRRQLKGTKEGCAEGDCGACSVVVGQLDGKRLRYRAVNACIQFLATLDGCQLLSVEDLGGGGDGQLHPVQREMIRQHGSQCGFCTPGFIMSMFALWHENPAAGKAEIEDALAGNLCRCTGYGPIIAAMQAALKDRDYVIQTDRITALLQQIRPDTLLLSESAQGVFIAPVSTSELVTAIAAYPDARLLAGGTDIGLWVTKMHRKLPAIIYLGSVKELLQAAETANDFSIGAAVTYADLPSALLTAYPDFGHVLGRIGAVQVRNLGTIGGNIANGSPIGDTPPMLIAMGAELVLQSAEGSRRMPLEDYFLAYGKQDLRAGEFVERVIVPKPAAGQRFLAYKISKRFDQDISALCGAFGLTIENGNVTAARIAFGGMAATPKRATRTERALIGRAWDEAAIRDAIAALGQDFQPISDMRASARYRETAAANLLWKVFAETADEPQQTRILA